MSRTTSTNPIQMWWKQQRRLVPPTWISVPVPSRLMLKWLLYKCTCMFNFVTSLCLLSFTYCDYICDFLRVNSVTYWLHVMNSDFLIFNALTLLFRTFCLHCYCFVITLWLWINHKYSFYPSFLIWNTT